jgi:hypothetical protein
MPDLSDTAEQDRLRWIISSLVMVYERTTEPPADYIASLPVYQGPEHKGLSDGASIDDFIMTPLATEAEYLEWKNGGEEMQSE